MATEDKFFAAVDVVNSLPHNGPFQPSDDLMLKFYAYFKQATEGPCTTPKPSFWEITSRNRWNAWKGLGNTPKKIAMEKYVEELAKVIETMSYNEKVSKFISSMAPFYEEVWTDDNDSQKADVDKEEIWTDDNDSQKADMDKEDMNTDAQRETKTDDFSKNLFENYQQEENIPKASTIFDARSLRHYKPIRCSESFSFAQGISTSNLKSSSENSSTVTSDDQSYSSRSSDSDSTPAVTTKEEVIEMFRNKKVPKNLQISTTKDLLILTVINVQHSLEDIVKQLEKLENLAATTKLESQKMKCENLESNTWSLTFPGTALVLLWPFAVHWCMHLIRASFERN